MGMSDWSSDVCSSELPRSAAAFGIFAIMLKRVGELRDGSGADQASGDAFAEQTFAARGLGRDDRQVASHRLQRHIAECFSNRGIDQARTSDVYGKSVSVRVDSCVLPFI